MSTFYLVLYVLIASTLADWVFRSARLRVFLYVACMAMGVSSCTQLGSRDFLLLDGFGWLNFFTFVGMRLLCERSRFFER